MPAEDSGRYWEKILPELGINSPYFRDLISLENFSLDFDQFLFQKGMLGFAIKQQFVPLLLSGPMMKPFLEICVDSFQAAQAAEAGGAHRIELCSSLLEGGLTPSYGFLKEACRRLKTPIFPMIRPRGGDFFYSDDEIAIMREDILQARTLGAKGIVLGILKQNGTVDVDRTKELVELAKPLDATFHRAFDLTPDLEQALEDVIRTGCRTILTSGGEAKISQGIAAADRVYRKASGRIEIMIGSGITEANIGELAAQTRIRTFHASLREIVPSPIELPSRLPDSEIQTSQNFERAFVSVERVRATLSHLDKVVL